jgi:hypothetical protein
MKNCEGKMPWETAQSNPMTPGFAGSTNDYSNTNSEVVVIASGLPRKPG